MNRAILTLIFAAPSFMQAQGQQFVISTYAGLPSATLPVPALSTAIGSPLSIATDDVGNVYFTSLITDSPAYYHGRYGVFKLDGNGVLTRIAGNTGEGYSGDGGPAMNAQFRLLNFDDEPGLPGITVDAVGNVYIADAANNRVRTVSGNACDGPACAAKSGIITTLAGNGTPGSSGDGGLAASAQLEYPSSLATQFGGSYIYIVSGDRIRRIFYAEGSMHIDTVAMAAPGSVLAVDRHLNFYVAGGGSVRKFAWPSIVESREFTTIAAEDGLAMAVDDSENVYLAQGGRVRKITPTGAISTFAGNGTRGFSGDGGPASSAQVCANGLAFARDGNLYLAEAQSRRIRKISPNGIITTVAGNAECCYSGDNGPAINAQFNFAPWGGGLAVDRGGNLYIADAANQRVRKVSPAGVVTTVAGNGVSNGYSGDGGPATGAQLNYPSEVVTDSRGNLYIADVGNQRVRKVSADGIITTVVEAFGRALAVDGADALYFADGGGVHKIDRAGRLTTLTTTPLNLPFGAAVDSTGNYYAAEIGGQAYRIRKVTPEGTITTVAGGDGMAGYSGDGGPAPNAQLNGPAALAIDSGDNLYVADSFNGRIRMISSSGTITTVAGNGTSGYSGDGGFATSAQFGSLSGLAVDSRGNLYAADQYYNAIRLLQPVGPSPVIGRIVNAASNVFGAIAPGELVVLTGVGLGPTKLVSAAPGTDGLYPSQLAGTAVQVNGIPANIVYTSATQVAAVVPASVGLSTTVFTITFQGQTSFGIPMPVAASFPGIFTVDSTGRGQAATVNQNGLTNAPVDWGDVIRILATGIGSALSGSVILYPDSGLQMVIPVSPENIQTNSAGVTQIDLVIPNGLDCGASMKVQVNNASSQMGVFLAARLCI